jgi:hypothetical protein
MLTHQLERLEKCPISTCEYHIKGFARKYDKNRHTLTHYKGTMVCGFCPGSGSAAENSFNRADVFKRHLTSVHGVEQTPPNSRKKGARLDSVTRATPRRNHVTGRESRDGKCSTCSLVFNDLQEFYDHLDGCVLRIVEHEDPASKIKIERDLLSGTSSLSYAERLQEPNSTRLDDSRRHPTQKMQAPERYSERYDKNALSVARLKSTGSKESASTDDWNFSRLMIGIGYGITHNSELVPTIQSSTDAEFEQDSNIPVVAVKKFNSQDDRGLWDCEVLANQKLATGVRTDMSKDRLSQDDKESQQTNEQRKQYYSLIRSSARHSYQLVGGCFGVPSFAQNSRDYSCLNIDFASMELTSDDRPRLGEQEVYILEAAFKNNPKPNAQTKRGIAEDMGVDLARINVSLLLGFELMVLILCRTGSRSVVQSGSRRRNKRL